MNRLRAWIVRMAGIFPAHQREREFADEIDSHLQMHIEDNLRSGITPEQARRDAILKLGGVESTKQAYRNRETIPLLENLLRDLAFAIRQLRRSPGFTCTAILMLALGVGASVALFAFVDAALIKPLPYRNPNRLVDVTETARVFPRANLSYPDYLDWKKYNTVFSSLDMYNGTGYLLSTPTGAEPVPGARVSDGFFRTLGIRPVLGRDFYAGEDLPGKPKTVMLSYANWQKRFGARKDVIGQTVALSGIPHTIIAVLPPEFQFALRGDAEFWAPFQAGSSPCDQRRSCHGLYGMGRLRDGVSVRSALANMISIATQLERQYPDSNRGQGASVLPLSEVIVGDVRPILLALLSGAGLLLVIACVNVSSLLLVRSESRKREIAVRGALGASPMRLVRQFITEGLVLVVGGSALGLMAAYGAMQILLRLISKDMMSSMPYLHGLGLNLHVLLFAAAISLLAAALFSITPMLRLPLRKVQDGLTQGGRGSAGTTWRRLGANLVVLELAIAMVLLVGAGLLGKSFYRLLHVELGFQPDHLATLQVAISETRYPKDEQVVAVERQIVSRAAGLPGVRAAGVTTMLPVSGNGNTNWIRFVGRPYHGEHNEVNERDVSSGYFTTLQAKLLRGRYFTGDEDATKPRVVIINKTLARQYFPGEDPVGKRIGDTDLSAKSIQEIIGVVDDVKEGSLDSEIWPATYSPFNQGPDTFFNVVVRTSQPEQTVLPTLAAAIHQVDPGIGTMDPATMVQKINDTPSASMHRSSAALVGGFAALALLLGVVGLYGVIAYSVSQRTREIGVRMALGAQRSSVYQLILKEAGWLTATGIAAGLLCSILAATLMSKLLFDVHAWDLPTLAGVAIVLGISALLASYFPARRAASVNPVVALHTE
ncbi:MAG: ADOP family duplicated permease [Acidobacteriaceae bacterium]